MSAVLTRTLKVGSLTVKNRLGMSPMCTNFGDAHGQVTEQLVDYYEARAAGGVGIIIVENASVDDGASRGNPGMLMAHSDALIPGLNRLAEAINRHRAVSVLQLNHMGAQGDPALARTPLVAPSAVTRFAESGPVHPLSVAEIETIIESFASAAERAIRAGFDGVEVHAAHGYLLSEFLSPGANTREDSYGGSEDKRLRILIEVLDRVRNRIGPGKILGVRLNGDDYVGDRGVEIASALRIAQAVEEAHVDFIDISAAVGESVHRMIQPVYLPHGTNVHLARAIKTSAGVPVFAVGSIANRALAEDVVDSGSADLVLLGRGLIADPNLPERWLAGDDAPRRKCIRCNDGCIQRIIEKKAITCTVNPLVGHESDWDPKTHLSEKPRHILVVGGGPAGLEAARVAALRGHHVTLCERQPELGGQVRFASLLSFKSDLLDLIPYYERTIEQIGVETRLSTEATPRLARDLQAEHVIVAIGAEPIVPVIPGIESCVPATLAHGDHRLLGDRVVVMGGGLVGCETALDLGRKGHHVTLVELLTEVLRGMNVTNRLGLLAALDEAHVAVLTGVETQRIDDAGIFARTAAGAEIELKADSVILSLGFVPRRDLSESWSQSGLPCAFVGDCVAPRNILAAVHEGFHAARFL